MDGECAVNGEKIYILGGIARPTLGGGPKAPGTRSQRLDIYPILFPHHMIIPPCFGPRDVLLCLMSYEDDELTPFTPEPPRRSYDEVSAALIESKGNVSAAARDLGYARSYLAQKISRTPALVALLEDLREEIVDTAETNVFNDVFKNDPVANRFILETLGKKRGYSRSIEGNGKDGELVVVIRSLAEKEASDGE